MDMFCKIGDTIGYVRRTVAPDGTRYVWELEKTKVELLVSRKDGVHVHTKRFEPFDDEAIKANTKIMRELDGVLLVQEPFVLDDEMSERIERWMEMVNRGPEDKGKAGRGETEEG